MKSTISAKDKRIVKAKLEGKKNPEIGQVEYPEANPTSQRQLVSRVLNKTSVAQYHDKELAKVLESNHVTKSQYIMNIGLAMTANKQDHTGDWQVDHASRLAGNRMAERFLKFSDEDKMQNPELVKALLSEDIDELQLLRVVKR